MLCKYPPNHQLKSLPHSPHYQHVTVITHMKCRRKTHKEKFPPDQQGKKRKDKDKQSKIKRQNQRETKSKNKNKTKPREK